MRNGLRIVLHSCHEVVPVGLVQNAKRTLDTDSPCTPERLANSRQVLPIATADPQRILLFLLLYLLGCDQAWHVLTATFLLFKRLKSIYGQIGRKFGWSPSSSVFWESGWRSINKLGATSFRAMHRCKLLLALFATLLWGRLRDIIFARALLQWKRVFEILHAVTRALKRTREGLGWVRTGTTSSEDNWRFFVGLIVVAC